MLWLIINKCEPQKLFQDLLLCGFCDKLHKSSTYNNQIRRELGNLVSATADIIVHSSVKLVIKTQSFGNSFS